MAITKNQYSVLTSPLENRTHEYRVDGHLLDLGFIWFLARYCFVCPILLGQVGIRQNGQITLAAMVEILVNKE